MQIRTPEMNHVAESGVASHWLYKEAEKPSPSCSTRPTAGCSRCWTAVHLGDSSEFLEHVKVDLFPARCSFTPKGKIFALPRGAAVVADFAYAVHTNVGNHSSPGASMASWCRCAPSCATTDRDHHRRPCQPQPGLARLCAHRQGPRQIRHFLKNAQQEEASTLGERLLDPGPAPTGLTLGQVGTFTGTACCASSPCRPAAT